MDKNTNFVGQPILFRPEKSLHLLVDNPDTSLQFKVSTGYGLQY
jgi:hypothetical protein